MNQDVKEFIEHLSVKPWSDYTKADYSIEQWHKACLVHQHTGAPTSKSQCKLPVRTPNGALNKNGVQAAAAALAGARGGVQASPVEKALAAKSLITYYHQMGSNPPPSLVRHSSVQDFIDHHGVKGMHWGVRRSNTKSSTENKRVSELRKKKPSQLTNKQLKDINERLNLETNYSRLTSKPNAAKKGKLLAAEILGTLGLGVTAYNYVKSPAGQVVVSHGAKLVKRILKSRAKTPIKQLTLF
jgi:hypothetical protein